MKRFIFICFLLNSKGSWGQEVIVEALSLEQEKIELSRSASVLRPQDSAVKSSTLVADWLRSVPGLDVVRQGSLGQTTSVFIRGARSEDTLVLIDGIEANDSMAPAKGFDFSSLSVHQIERIEVYRGPQGVRFGAGALGGVINIITKEGSLSPLTSYDLEVGSYQSRRGALAHSGKQGSLGYSLGYERFSTEGFSAASENRDNREKDGADIQSSGMKITWRPEKSQTKIEGLLRFSESRVDVDRQGGVGGDDPNNESSSRQLASGVSGQKRFFNDQIKSLLGVNHIELLRNNRNSPDSKNTTDSMDEFRSENNRIYSENEWLWGENHTFRWGLQANEERGFSDSRFNGTRTLFSQRSQSNSGISFTYLFDSPTWFYDVGARQDQSSQVGGVRNHRLSVGRQFPDWEFKSFVSMGTGYKLPSLYQLYSVYGDNHLRQEQGETTEMTFEKKWRAQYLASITFFENKYRDLIDFDLINNKYFNVARAKSRGYEVQGSSQFSQNLKMDVNYTHLESRDEITGWTLLRRPEQTWSLSAQFTKGRSESALKYQFKGSRPDVDPNTFERHLSPSYDLVSLSSSYQLKSSFRLGIRIENLLNKPYEEVEGYGTAGTTCFVGVAGDL